MILGGGGSGRERATRIPEEGPEDPTGPSQGFRRTTWHSGFDSRDCHRPDSRVLRYSSTSPNLVPGRGTGCPQRAGKGPGPAPSTGKASADLCGAWPDDWEDLRWPVECVAQTIEADWRYKEEQAKLRDQEKAPEGEQPPGEPAPNPLWDGRVTPDHWEDNLGEPTGEISEGPEEWTTRSNSEQGEETNFEF
jgi:hypothetical protein